jgi:predicted transcriptional regulator
METAVLTPRKVRRQKIAQGVLQGKTYEAIADELGLTGEHRRNAVCNSVQRGEVQQEIREELEKSDYNKADIRRIISLVLQSAEENARSGKLTSSQAKVLEIASRTEAMLTDKQEVQSVVKSLDGAKEMSTDELLSALTDRLRAESTGVTSK